jgi:hypothetical protein
VPKSISKESSSVSLREYMEQDRQETLFPKSIHLCDISAQDSMSVESTFLAVSFDDDYPQLVLQSSSLDGGSVSKDRVDYASQGKGPEEDWGGSLSKQKSQVNAQRHSRKGESSHHLGVSFPHPARRSLSSNCVSSAEERRKTSTPQWLDEKVDEVWERIDGSSEEDSDTILAPMDSSMISRPAPTRVETQFADWDDDKDDEEGGDDMMRWSFSNDESDVSFSSILGDVASQPLCRIDMAHNLCGNTNDDRPFDECD